MLDFVVDDFKGEGPYGVVVEFKACHLLLEPPGLAVHVEDSSAEKVAEDHGKRFPLWVVVEPRLEDVLHVVAVRGDRVPQDVDVDGLCLGVSEEMCVPIAEVVEVFRPA